MDADGFVTVGPDGYFPDIRVRVGFDSKPRDYPQVLTTISDYVRSVTTGPRGRRPLVDRTEAARLAVVLDNLERRFDQTFEGVLANYSTNPSFEADYELEVRNSVPLGYYRLHADGTDSSGNGLTMAKTGTVTYGGAGALGAGQDDLSALFDGATGYLSSADAAFDVMADAWTVEAWVYPNAARDTNACAIATKEYGAAGSNLPFILCYGNPSSIDSTLPNVDSCVFAGIYEYAGVGWQAVTDGVALPLNTWTHIAATFDGVKLRLYRNGVKVAERSAKPVSVPVGMHTYLGRRWDLAGTTPYFPGRLDEVALYDRALTGYEVLRHYNMSASPLFAFNGFGGAGVTGYSHSWVTTDSRDGHACVQQTAVGGATNSYTAAIGANFSGGAAQMAPVVAGETAYVRASGKVVQNCQQIILMVYWWKADGTALAASTVQTITNPAVDEWYDLAGSAVAPAGAAWFAARIQFNNIPNGATFIGRVDGYYQGLVDYGSYIDGDSDNCRWAGSPSLSQTYYGGPYFGNLKPNKRIYVDARWNGVIYPVLEVLADEWPQGWPSNGRDAIVTLNGTDKFKTLGRFNLPALFSRSVELPGARIGAVLDEAGQPSQERRLDVGNSELAAENPPSEVACTLTSGSPSVTTADTSKLQAGQAVTGTGVPDGAVILTVDSDTTFTLSENATVSGAETLSVYNVDSVGAGLDYAQKASDSERGLLFVGADGYWVFQNRHYRLNTNAKWAFGDSATNGELPYIDVTPSYTEQDIANDVHVQLPNQAETVSVDSTSQDDNGIISLTINTLLSDRNEAQSIADYELGQRKDARTRIDSMVLDGSSAPADLWPVILSLEISDHILVVRRPPGGGDAQAYECNVENISHSIQPGRWQTTVQLSPADTSVYWVLGTSVLGTDTRLSV
jgi:hypothetical protein